MEDDFLGPLLIGQVEMNLLVLDNWTELFLKPWTLVIKEENIEKYGFTPLYTPLATLYFCGSVRTTHTYNSLLHKDLLVKVRKCDYWTASWFGKSFMRIFLRYIVTQYVQLRDLLCVWPLQLVTSKDWNLGWLHVTMHKRYTLIQDNNNWQ